MCAFISIAAQSSSLPVLNSTDLFFFFQNEASGSLIQQGQESRSRFKKSKVKGNRMYVTTCVLITCSYRLYFLSGSQMVMFY